MGELCSQCHIRPVHSWTVTYTRNGREFTETKYFYEGRPEDNAKLCAEDAAAKADAVVGKELANISRNMGSVITTLTGNELAGHAYHAFGVNAPAIMEEVEAGADIIDVVVTYLHRLAVDNNAWAEERERNDKKIVIPDDEEIVRGAIALALSMKDGKLATVTNLIGDRLVGIEETYPDQRFDIVITEARRMKVDATLALIGIFIAEAKKAVEEFRNHPDGADLYERLTKLDRARLAMSDAKERGGEFELFVEGRRLYQRATELKGDQDRRETLRKSYSGRFSSAFRAPTASVAETSTPTIGDAVDSGTKEKLDAMVAQEDDEPTSVPADLSSDESDDAATDATSTPATVDQNA